MIEHILPAHVRSAVLRADEDVAPLFREEEKLVLRAAASRLRDFAAGRSCARKALQGFGISSASIMKGRTGEPLWPDGYSGSITHCPGYCAAAVARQSLLRSLGIDAEPHDALPTELNEMVLNDKELVWTRTMSTDIHWPRVVFSVKESIYKAAYPLLHRWLDFHDVSIEPGASGDTLIAHIPESSPLRQSSVLSGIVLRYLVRDGFIVTSAVIPPVVDGTLK